MTTSPVWPIVVLTLKVSGTALLLASLVGVPLGAWIGLNAFRGRWLDLVLLNTASGLPPVLVGLVVYLLLSRAGPLGGLGWLFTPTAMVVAQTILAWPLITVLTADTLLNNYAVLQLSPEKHPDLNHAGAEQFISFLFSPTAQQLIADFGRDKFGQPLFFLAH